MDDFSSNSPLCGDAKQVGWKAPTALATLPTVTGQGRREVWKSEGVEGQILIQGLLKENVWLIFFPKIWGDPLIPPKGSDGPAGHTTYYSTPLRAQAQSLVLIWFPPSPKPGSSYYRAPWYIMKSWWKAYFLFGFFVWPLWPFWPLLGPHGLKPSLSGIGKKLYCQEMVQVPQQHQGRIFIIYICIYIRVLRLLNLGGGTKLFL